MTDTKPDPESALATTQIYRFGDLIEALRRQAQWTTAAVEWLEMSERSGRDLMRSLDAERARAERAEAALRGFLAAHDFAGAESWDCTGETRQRFEHAASAAKLLLEEPANG